MFDPRVRKIPWRRKWQPIPVFLDCLMAQLVKNLPAIRETWVPSLGWEDPLEKGTAAHSSILAWRIPWTVVYGVTKSETRLSDLHFQLSLGHRTRH